MPAVPKPVKSTPETRRAERQKRDQHPFKVYTKKKAPKPLRRSKIGVRKPFKPWRVKSRVIRSLNQRTGIKAGTRLKVVGKRGKRLAPKDNKARAEIAGMPCACGCNRKAFWVHLKTRGSEALRHLDWVTIPGCVDLDYWLDQGPGAGVKAELFKLAESLQRRLTEAEVSPVLSDNGFYTWLLDKRTVI